MSTTQNPTDDRARSIHERHAAIFGDKSRHSPEHQGESEGGRSSGGGMTLDMAQKANKGDQEPVTQQPAAQASTSKPQAAAPQQADPVQQSAVQAPTFKPTDVAAPEKNDEAKKDEPQKEVPKSAQINPNLDNLNKIQPPSDIKEWRAQKAEKAAQAQAAPTQSQTQTQVQVEAHEPDAEKPRSRTMR